MIHLLGLPVRQLLPMHWPAILAGLVYGWRSGMVIGAASPIVSYLISGMPRSAGAAAMTFELAAYGFIAGYFVEVLQRGRLQAALASVIGGRVVFLARDGVHRRDHDGIADVPAGRDGARPVGCGRAGGAVAAAREFLGEAANCART